MKLQKLFTMAPAEMAFRGRQAVFKTVERVSTSPGDQAREVNELFKSLNDNGHDVDSPAMLFRQGYPEFATRSLQSGFRAASPLRFFAGASDVLVPELINLYLPQARLDIIKSADAVCAGEFDTLGYGRLRFSDKDNHHKINWHLDAVSGKVSPLLHWSRINPLDFSQVGDHKVVWELNRHQWMIELALAWQLTGEERYALVFMQRVRAWMQDNPPGIGINWCSSLEVSYRLISWSWALVMFRNCEALSAHMHLSMTSWLQAHAQHIERYLSVYYSPNTHLTGEALGLFYAGVLFPDITDAERWRTLGRKLLLEQLTRQVHDDGVYFEQSTRYQYYTVEIYLHFMILSQRHGDTLPENFSARLQSMLDFLLNLRRPDGSFPQIGDTDGGCLLPLVHRGSGDFRALFSVAAALFRREDYAWAAGGSTPELICLLGPPGHYGYLALKHKAPAVIASRHYPEGGYVIMRSDWRTRGHQLILDVGPLGCPDSAAHGHADLLSIQCSAYGDNYLVDPGSGNYTADPYWRNYFRSTHAHSAVTVDGLSQMEPDGPFGWRGPRSRVNLHSYDTTPLLTLVDASHDAWAHLPDPVVHRRRIMFVRQRYWVMVDDLSAQQEHEFALHFQFAPIAVTLEGNGWVRAYGERGSCLQMHVSASSLVNCTISTGERHPAAGWISDNYGHQAPAPALRCTARSALPMRFITILLPQAEADADTPDMLVSQSLLNPGTHFLQIQIDNTCTDQIVVSDDDITITQGKLTCAE
ncbi:MAG: alginate lyase family protein [Gammaproteobacteria bacterium]|nr:alginate lyase family protein [Gammaproteobacteria bacterium]MDP2140736.1 alginate lyase family protein [Gammaproteobacteria bacterium]MDP2346990.1 alginate lyase family protein [Gammaproteobacteria bacterium]